MGCRVVELIKHVPQDQRVSDQALVEAFVSSKEHPTITSHEQAMIRLVIGRELGLGVADSMGKAFHIYDGSIELSSKLMAASIKRSGRYNYRVIEYTEECVSIEFLSVLPAGEEVLGTVTWTIEDAKRAGLTRKANWQRYPRQMLRSRVISEGYTTFCPDALGPTSVYVDGELDRERRDVTPSSGPDPADLQNTIAAIIETCERVEKFDPGVTDRLLKFSNVTAFGELGGEAATAAMALLTRKIHKHNETHDEHNETHDA